MSTTPRAGRPLLSRRFLERLVTAVAIAGLIAGWLLLNLEGIYFRDTLAYWRPDLDDLYGQTLVGVPSTYLYSPAFAQLVTPLGLLPWPVFAGLWSALNIGVLVWLVGPRLAAVLFLIPASPVAAEITTGNVHLLLAAMVVIGFRAPWTWAFALLTKVTPGVGLLWFVAARRWRDALIAVAVTTAIAAVSFLIAPDAWIEWIELLRRSASVPVPPEIGAIPGPLWLRTLLAAVVAVVGGLLGWRWLAAVAATLALPVPWSSGLSLLVAVIPLTRHFWAPALDRASSRLSGAGTNTDARHRPEDAAHRPPG